MRIHLRDISGRILAAIMTACLFFFFINPAWSSARSRDNQSKVREVKDEIGALNRQLSRVVSEYESADIKLSQINRDLAKTQKRWEETQKDLNRSQVILDGRIASMYKYGNVSFAEVLLGTKDFQEFSARMELLKRIGEEDTHVLNEVRKKKAEIEKRSNQLREGKRQQRSLVRLLVNRKAQIETGLRKQQALLAKEEARVARLNQLRLSQPRRRLRLAVSRAAYTFNFRGGFAFPVAGAHAFRDDFGDPRAGHRHQGNDIFALRGTPAVAVVNGSVNAEWTHGGGNTIYLYGEDGNTYVYMHLSGYAVTGGHVSQGEVVGYVGNTGNASGGSSHLHFEIHPGGGGAADPYSTLRAAE